MMTKSSYTEWKQKSQTQELDYHITSEWRRSGDFMPQTKILYEGFGFSSQQFADKVILDLGAGSQLRTCYFEKAHIIVLEPLAHEFIKKVDNNNLEDAEAILNVPAEAFVPWMSGVVDFCISINVLDHCFNFEQICKNVYQYLKKDGLAFFLYDYHEKIDDMHPLSITDEASCALFESIGFKIVQFTKGLPSDYYIKYKSYSYGHGDRSLNFWLKK